MYALNTEVVFDLQPMLILFLVESVSLRYTEFAVPSNGQSAVGQDITVQCIGSQLLLL